MWGLDWPLQKTATPAEITILIVGREIVLPK